MREGRAGGSDAPVHRAAIRERVRCHGVVTRRAPDGRWLVKVSLEGIEGISFVGRGEGPETDEGRVRAGATAAMGAMLPAAGGGLRLRLKGVKMVRAFDTMVVIAALRAERGPERYDLLGSAEVPRGDPARAGVLAVLNATNRILREHGRSPAEDRKSEGAGS